MRKHRNNRSQEFDPVAPSRRAVLRTGGALLAAPLLAGGAGGAAGHGPHPVQAGVAASSQPPQQGGREVQSITIRRSGSQPPSQGPAEYFTGTVRVELLFQPTGHSRMSGAFVTFDPGARTAWHTHPLGQTLIVTAGAGWVQQWGGPVEEMREGDVVRIPPGVKHWHGATATTRMTHLALQEHLDGKAVEWMEKVSDEQYKHP
jgi:quercetin dioxygenase-like cupin family protein